MIKLAIILVAFDSEKYINTCLAPWLTLKFGTENEWGDRMTPPAADLDIKICAVSSVFKNSGFKYEQNENTAKILRLYEEHGAIEKYIEIKDREIEDYESRVAAWDYLKQFDIDYIFQVDSDEFHMTKEILNIVNFIKAREFIDCFKINFKNYIGKTEEKRYVADFNPLRIINNKVNGGFRNFNHDNDGYWNNGEHTTNASTITIPKHIAFPCHYSWNYDNDPTKIINKINFQKQTLGVCSYKFNKETDKLEFDKEYYARFGKTPPEVFEDRD